MLAFEKPNRGLITDTSPSLPERLKLSDDQVQRCRAIVKEGQTAIANVARFPIEMDAKNGPPTVEAIRKLIESPKFKADKQTARQAGREANAAAMQRIKDVLTNDQRNAYDKLLGKPFVVSKLQWGPQDEGQADLYAVANAFGLAGGQRADPSFNTSVARPALRNGGTAPSGPLRRSPP